jgi:hypothetical protein
MDSLYTLGGLCLAGRMANVAFCSMFHIPVYFFIFIAQVRRWLFHSLYGIFCKILLLYWHGFVIPFDLPALYLIILVIEFLDPEGHALRKRLEAQKSYQSQDPTSTPPLLPYCKYPH